MGLFGAALKVAVCFQQSPHPTEKHCYLLPRKQTLTRQNNKLKCTVLCLTKRTFICIALFRCKRSEPNDWTVDVLPKIRGNAVCVYESPLSGLYIYMFTSSCCTPLMFPPFVAHSSDSEDVCQSAMVV